MRRTVHTGADLKTDGQVDQECREPKGADRGSPLILGKETITSVHNHKELNAANTYLGLEADSSLEPQHESPAWMTT